MSMEEGAWVRRSCSGIYGYYVAMVPTWWERLASKVDICKKPIEIWRVCGCFKDACYLKKYCSMHSAFMQLTWSWYHEYGAAERSIDQAEFLEGLLSLLLLDVPRLDATFSRFLIGVPFCVFLPQGEKGLLWFFLCFGHLHHLHQTCSAQIRVRCQFGLSNCKSSWCRWGSIQFNCTGNSDPWGIVLRGTSALSRCKEIATWHGHFNVKRKQPFQKGFSIRELKCSQTNVSQEGVPDWIRSLFLWPRQKAQRADS